MSLKSYLTYQRATHRRGAIIVMVSFTLVTLVSFATLAVDVGYICALTGEAQSNADSAALAGASAIKESKYDSYFGRALTVLSRNQQTQGFNSLEDQVIEIGRWDKALQTFAILQPFEASSANAVRVISWRRDVSLFFAPIMGRKFTDITRRAVAMVTPSCNGIWGMTDVSVPGTVMIDSYDSEEGAYVSGAANSNGDVCSNGEITVSGTADIYGDVLSATGDVTINGGAAMVTGVYEGAIDTVTAPSVEFPSDIAMNNDNASIGLTDQGNDPLDNGNVSVPGSWDLILIGETLTLAPGTYYFDDIIMAAGAQLTLTGVTMIYLIDDLWMTSNSVLNTTINPADLTIMCSGQFTSTIHLSGGAAFYGAIMAPNSDIELRGNSDYYGALVGDTIDFGGNFQFHVDESLELINTLKGPVVLVQ